MYPEEIRPSPSLALPGKDELYRPLERAEKTPIGDPQAPSSMVTALAGHHTAGITFLNYPWIRCRQVSIRWPPTLVHLPPLTLPRNVSLRYLPRPILPRTVSLRYLTRPIIVEAFRGVNSFSEELWKNSKFPAQISELPISNEGKILIT